MQKIRHFIFSLPLFLIVNTQAQTVTTVEHFDKIIVSPHIQATFVEGEEESVTIENCTVDSAKIHIEVEGKTLRIYLEGAKEVDKNETDYSNGHAEKHSIYKGTVVTAVVTYKTLNELSIRGEEKQVCKSVLKGEKLSLKIYGESDVILNEVNLGELKTTIYGNSNLQIMSGFIKSQKYTTYGEGKINSLAISGNSSTITAYGDTDFRVNVSDEIRITSFGDASLHYTGNPSINKGLHFGDMHIEKME